MNDLWPAVTGMDATAPDETGLHGKEGLRFDSVTGLQFSELF